MGARADYAIRALAELSGAAEPMTADAIAEARTIPKPFLTVILSQLVRSGLVHSRRGRIGGYTLTRAPADISIAEVIDAVGESRAGPPVAPQGPYQRLRGQLSDVIEHLTLADLLR